MSFFGEYYEKKKKVVIANCKPRSRDYVKEIIDELGGSFDEPLDMSPRMRKASHQQALHMIKQFSDLAKECNYIVEHEN